MTKHLEERLSEALDAAAGTVPDTAVPPELFPAKPAAQRRWTPVLAIGLAMTAVVVAVAIPVAISRNRSAPPPAASMCPEPPAVEALTYEKREYAGSQDPAGSQYGELDKLPFGSPPRVPFVMAKDGPVNVTYLEDLGVRVPLPDRRLITSIGRVDCGWVVDRRTGADGDLPEIGVLSTDGSFRSFGRTTAEGASLSPDGSRLAYVAPEAGGKASVVTVSVATGKRLAATPASTTTEVAGWNSHGVWFLSDGAKYVTKMWEPGSAPVTVDTGKHRLTAYPGTDRMLLTDPEPVYTNEGSDACVQVVTLGTANKLQTVVEKCGGAGGTLSPDGSVLVAETGTIAQGYLVETGAKTGLNVSSTIVTPDYAAIWEDPNHVLSAASLGSSDRVFTTRCNVRTGACERIQDGPESSVIVGPDLGRP
ncbi:hypothetical protein [Kribbella sp. CA-294648]|uniref:hypothetical protein n=1 Tax=Kribbella sp. CA-294648 TaxID=3239948 RepID=UPI003D925F56